MVSLLPNIKKLNGGAPISVTEREDSERAFIRRFTPQDDKPDRYYKLSEKCVNKVWFKCISLIVIFSGMWYICKNAISKSMVALTPCAMLITNVFSSIR